MPLKFTELRGHWFDFIVFIIYIMNEPAANTTKYPDDEEISKSDIKLNTNEANQAKRSGGRTPASNSSNILYCTSKAPLETSSLPTCSHVLSHYSLPLPASKEA